MKSQLITTTIILLFLGVAIAPLIQAEPQLTDEDYVEVHTEFCGLNREPVTVKLTQAEADELEQLITDIETRLSQVETREETIVIFNEAIEEFQRFGLLGDVGVKHVKRLVIGGTFSQRFFDKIDSTIKNIPDDNNSNYFCLIGGHLTNSAIQKPLSRFIQLTCPSIENFMQGLLSWAHNNNYTSLEKYLEAFTRLFLPIYFSLGLALFELINNAFYFFPITIASVISAGRGASKASKGHVTSYGSLGVIIWNGTLWGIASDVRIESIESYYYPAILGFTGLKIHLVKHDVLYLFGFAFKASMSHERPW